MKLTISNDILSKLPDFNVIAYSMIVDNKTTEVVTEYLQQLEKEYYNKYLPEEITKIPRLKETRDGYKKLGKDPSHTRAAAEALLRRFVKGTGIYRLGDVIDLGNILSLKTNRSVCVVDYDKLQGDILIRVGHQDEPFEAINRGSLNIHNLPVYVDNIGPFGTPTSDTDRTKVDNNTSKIYIMIICFSHEDIYNDENLLLDIYQKYANARDIKKIEVQYGEF